MAVTIVAATLLESLKSKVLTGVWGRRLGLDPAGFLVGSLDVRNPVESLTTTASSSAINAGLTLAQASGSSQTCLYTLQLPSGAGINKTLRQNSTSTGTMQFQASTGTACGFFAASDGSSQAVVSLIGNGATVVLESLSTAWWAVVGVTGTTASPLVQYTTST